jgi:glycosyltransferase involved in cell wall biosynthesis
VTVCLNAGKALDRTVESVLAQDPAFFEYIVKDGLSEDGSMERIRNLSEIRLMVGPDHGIYDAMNQALAECKGRFVCFLNAGDTFYSPDTLGRVADFMRQHPGRNLYYGHAFSEGKQRIHPPRFSMAFLYEGHLCHQALFVERGLYARERGFDVSYTLLADRDFLMKVLWARKVPSALMPFFVCRYDLSGLTAREEYGEIKRRELLSIQKTYFRPGHRFWIWLYLRGLVKPRAVVRGILGRRETVEE